MAWRIALQVKSDAARRRDQERRAAERSGEAIAPDSWHDDTAAVIHQEIDRLPDRYRRPVVLCYLEDMTYQQAASHLRWSEATTRGRLAQARELLRARLSRRGVTLAGVAAPGAAAPVPAALLRSAVRSACHLALGESATAASATTIVLMKQAARGMMIARLEAIGAAALLVAALTGLAAALAAAAVGGDDRMPAAPPQVMKGGPAPDVAAAPTRPGKGETMPICGRVLAPDGRPAAGADVFVVVNLPRPLTMSVETSRTLGPARTDAAGRFVLDVPRTLVRRRLHARHDRLPAGRRGGPARLDPRRRAGGHDPPRPRGAGLHPPARPGGTAREPGQGPRGHAVEEEAHALHHLHDLSPRPPLAGLARDDDRRRPGAIEDPRPARDTEFSLEVLDDRFAVQRVGLRAGQAAANGAATPTFTLTPAHWLEGRVRLGESGPVATGAKFLVISHSNPEEDPQGIRIGGRTDAEGRFRVNVPRCESHEVLVYPPEGSPFAFRRVVTAATQGVSQQIDVILPRGVLVKGRVVESPSGRAVAGAILEYRPRRAGNPNFQEEAVAVQGGRQPTAVTGPDGSFRIGVLPGPGHLLVEAPEHPYLNVETTDGDIKSGVPGGARLHPDGLLAVDCAGRRGGRGDHHAANRQGLARRMLDPAGRPATGAEIIGWDGQNPRTAGDGTFDLVGLDPAKPVTVYFLDRKNQLGRVATFSGSDLDRPATVRLERCGSARARFIDCAGPTVRQRAVPGEPPADDPARDALCRRGPGD